MAELTAVLAIMTIIISSIVGFSTLFSSQVKTNEARAAFLEETAAFRTYVQQEFAKMDDGTEFDITKLYFLQSRYDQIKSITYEINTSKTILKITVENEKRTETQSFVIFSRCGATFTQEGGTQP